MGLDMFLELRKHEYQSAFYKTKNCTIKLTFPKELKDFFGDCTESVTRDTSYRVGYWRKANAIHNWFVTNCAQGVDDGSTMIVSAEKLKDLLELCNRVLKDPSIAAELLPTKEGFFFGSTDYDEVYFEKLKSTVKILEPVIRFLDTKTNKGDSSWTAEYSASW